MFFSIFFNQVQSSSMVQSSWIPIIFFRDPMDFLAGFSLEMPSEPPQDLDPKRSPGLPAPKQRPNKTTHGRRKNKNWQSLPSLTMGIFFNIFFNIQCFVDLNVMSMISYQYSIHGDFFQNTKWTSFVCFFVCNRLLDSCCNHSMLSAGPWLPKQHRPWWTFPMKTSMSFVAFFCTFYHSCG